MAACDQRHQGAGPDESHSGEVCAGRSSEERSQRERRETLDPETVPSRPRHVRVELQAHRVRARCPADPETPRASTVLFVCYLSAAEAFERADVETRKLCLCSLQPWDAERCLVQFEKDGVIQTQEKSQRQHNGLSYSHSWTSQQKVSPDVAGS